MKLVLRHSTTREMPAHGVSCRPGDLRVQNLLLTFYRGWRLDEKNMDITQILEKMGYIVP